MAMGLNLIKAQRELNKTLAILQSRKWKCNANCLTHTHAHTPPGKVRKEIVQRIFH